MGSNAIAFFAGAELATRSADTEYPFRQDSDFWYLTGFDHPGATAVLRTDGGPAYTLFVEPRDPSAEVWTGYRPGVEGAIEDYGADEAHPRDELLTLLAKIIERADCIYHVLGRRPEIDRALTDALESLRQRTKLGFSPASSIVDPRFIVHEMRLMKEPGELEIMRRAAAITSEAHHGAAQLARPGCHEYELEAALGHVFRRRGGRGPAYNPIVAGGANATTLHYVTNDMPLPQGELVLIDAGVELDGYASDVTRTYPIGGRLEGAHRAVYEIVLEAQEVGLEACRPGTTLPDIHAATLRKLVEGMVSLGLLSGTVDDVIQKETYRAFFMHGTSHWLGLDVHDVGSYSLEGKPRKLEPGMVFTVEPGLYIPVSSETAPERFRGIGVRIEDDVVITPDGFENLNEAIPKRPDEIEAWMRD